MDLDGLAVTVLDTAGIRPTQDEVEGLGIARAIARAEDADLRVMLLDEAGLPDGFEPKSGDIVLRGKADLLGGEMGVSGLTGQGIRELLSAISAELGSRAARAATLTRHRHRVAVLRAIEALETARHEVSGEGMRQEIAAEYLRAATRALDSLVGRIGVEDLLAEIFASFCIGK
jgi:tRNA modification GTPase